MCYLIILAKLSSQDTLSSVSNPPPPSKFFEENLVFSNWPNEKSYIFSITGGLFLSLFFLIFSSFSKKMAVGTDRKEPENTFVNTQSFRNGLQNPLFSVIHEGTGSGFMNSNEKLKLSKPHTKSSKSADTSEEKVGIKSYFSIAYSSETCPLATVTFEAIFGG